MFRQSIRQGIAGARPITAAAATIAALACLSTASTFASAKSVPLFGTYSGFAWLEPDFSGAHCLGNGNFTHLGAVTSQCDAVFLDYAPIAECAGIGTGWGIPNVNTATLTAANGDQLVLVLNDLACEISPGVEYQATGVWVVDSAASTGRFATATGTGNMRGAVDFASGDFHCVVVGDISY